MEINIFDRALLDDSIYDDPYLVYKKLRNTNPVCWSKIKKAWIVTRFYHIEEGINSPDTSAIRDSIQTKSLPDKYYHLFSRFYKGWLMYQDPPSHSRLKKIAYIIFSKNKIQSIISNINTLANNLVLKSIENKQCDIVNEYANILAVQGICELIGITRGDYEKISTWSLDIVNFMQGRCDILDPQILKVVENSIKKLESFVEKLCLNHLDDKNLNLYDFLNSGRKEQDLELRELFSIISNILMDGHEPIASAISNSVLALVKNPEKLQILLDKNEMLDSTIDELLRFDPPFQYIVRNASNDFYLDNILIKAVLEGIS